MEDLEDSLRGWDRKPSLPSYETLEGLMLLLYLKHYDVLTGSTDIPAWTQDLLAYLWEGAIP